MFRDAVRVMGVTLDGFGLFGNSFLIDQDLFPLASR